MESAKQRLLDQSLKKMISKSVKPTIVLIGIGTIVFLVLVVFWGGVAGEANRMLGAQIEEDKRYLVTLLGGVITFLAVAYNAAVRTDQLNETMKQNKHLAYAQALAQLGHEDSAVQKAGLSSLYSHVEIYPEEASHAMKAVCAIIRDRANQAYRAHVHRDGKPCTSELKPFQVKPDSFVQEALNTFFRTPSSLFQNAPKNLEGIHLESARLSKAHLESSNLSGASLVGACLSGAYLQAADLTQSHLQEANLSGAHLNEAHLNRTHLDGAQMRGAYVGGAHWAGAQCQLALNLDQARGLPHGVLNAWQDPQHQKAREKLMLRIKKEANSL